MRPVPLLVFAGALMLSATARPQDAVTSSVRLPVAGVLQSSYDDAVSLSGEILVGAEVELSGATCMARLKLDFAGLRAADGSGRTYLSHDAGPPSSVSDVCGAEPYLYGVSFPLVSSPISIPPRYATADLLFHLSFDEQGRLTDRSFVEVIHH